jgi:nucleotide-binding universal stress UspA family protein
MPLFDVDMRVGRHAYKRLSFNQIFPMRTILVLTDFSLSARNGAELGLHLASQLQIRLLLFHVYQPPIEVKVKNPLSYPLEDEIRATHDPDYQLWQEVIRLLQIQQNQALMPVSIETCSFQGTFHEGLRFVADKDIYLAVTGDHHQGTDFFNLENHVSESEKLLSCPLLVVPSAYRIPSKIHHIAFATDLANSDIQALTWLLNLAEKTKSTLFTGHISLPTFNMSSSEETAAAVFMRGMEKLAIPLNTYQNYFTDDIPAALKDFCADKQADLLALVYKKHSRLWHWLYGSTTAALLSDHEQPLLLIPEIS